MRIALLIIFVLSSTLHANGFIPLEIYHHIGKYCTKETKNQLLFTNKNLHTITCQLTSYLSTFRFTQQHSFSPTQSQRQFQHWLSQMPLLQSLRIGDSAPWTSPLLSMLSQIRQLRINLSNSQHISLQALSSLHHLQHLSIDHASSLQTLPLISICSFKLSVSTLLMDIELPPSITQLGIRRCVIYNTTEVLSKLTNLSDLQITHCKNKLINCEFLRSLTQLTSLKCHTCYMIQLPENLVKAIQLKKLDLADQKNLKDLSFISRLTNLQFLRLEHNDNLSNLESLQNCPNLSSLQIILCSSLKNLNGVRNLQNLNSLFLMTCHSITSLDELQNLPNLTTVSLRKCRALQDANALLQLPKLNHLFIHHCKQLDLSTIIDQLPENLNLTYW